ncbi:unnamed protein product [Durusdinium trenchii]|uniref:Uncharacterized protein n=1 Tax=Durusdinium trenchii TaxID=1381693 RepID=A0ABP0K6B3_9DINO
MSMPLTLYAPMRDGDLNDAMVGLFSDWRDLNVPCSSHVSLLGFCLDLAELIRHRRWTVFNPINNAHNILVNILPLDEQARGEQQFIQTRKHEYGGRRGSAPDRRRAYKAPHRPMRITLEQEAPDAWWISLDLNADCYPTEWCRGFVSSLADTIQDLKSRPMLAVLHADWSHSLKSGGESRGREGDGSARRVRELRDWLLGRLGYHEDTVVGKMQHPAPENYSREKGPRLGATVSGEFGRVMGSEEGVGRLVLVLQKEMDDSTFEMGVAAAMGDDGRENQRFRKWRRLTKTRPRVAQLEARQDLKPQMRVKQVEAFLEAVQSDRSFDEYIQYLRQKHFPEEHVVDLEEYVASEMDPCNEDLTASRPKEEVFVLSLYDPFPWPPVATRHSTGPTEDHVRVALALQEPQGVKDLAVKEFKDPLTACDPLWDLGPRGGCLGHQGACGRGPKPRIMSHPANWQRSDVSDTVEVGEPTSPIHCAWSQTPVWVADAPCSSQVGRRDAESARR